MQVHCRGHKISKAETLKYSAGTEQLFSQNFYLFSGLRQLDEDADDTRNKSFRPISEFLA
jgi:hypothetical protein